ncbi:MAG: 16S rRNA (adenine(1518)-N(6)/adenine(1519)-N(6))-dimethyltransferase RsmA [bacterium]|nr:16S rRNA (adenine(1518)-N(6)/adenine(1519)-N(6))-dimethyltransferase RsmA [bacterium]
MGQNFLVDEVVLAELVEAAQLKKTDTVVEVGPGLGVLTQELVKRAGKVIAVEKDENLYQILKNMYSTSHNPSYSRRGIKIVNQDILKFHLDKYINEPYKVVANIPYYLTSKLLQHFLTLENKPKLMVFMIQKEVGERIVAAPGKLSILGISVQVFSNPLIVSEVSKTSFWPVPKVDSVILQITPKNKYPEIENEKLFFKILKIAFSGKRKQIHNTLSSGLKIEKEKLLRIFESINIDPKLRPQDLTIEQWIELYKRIRV